ncbi:hypothetical protein AWJ20_3033 [Sugiyamaella lignohabitans]|uniref:RNA helicase aquarius N-terminal domain-containing protein n=1 Tax=Sugiyamaella lignohabitans TaxID=796027 RepID=A0A167FK88_9ASCO|nr:uncharacterized protein AWJ20_3033 [Sugiyamaella lignohabitans]ANB15406.1 hypothetical protein AWJ20_3033 [Sugiyamaella lignohabitans]
MSVSFEDIRASTVYKLAKASWLLENNGPNGELGHESAQKFSTKIVSNIYRKLESDEDHEINLESLKYLKCLECYLWPNLSEESTDDHIVSIAILSTQNEEAWSKLTEPNRLDYKN